MKRKNNERAKKIYIVTSPEDVEQYYNLVENISIGKNNMPELYISEVNRLAELYTSSANSRLSTLKNIFDNLGVRYQMGGSYIRYYID